jgi:sugar/nucleoside kinase (ribokinase family)
MTKVPERTTVATGSNRFFVFIIHLKSISFVVDGIKEYRWKKPAKVVDTHGCGDAFAGGSSIDCLVRFTLLKESFNFIGFLAYFSLGKTVDQCVSAGLYCAYENLQRLGCQYPDKPTYNGESLYR